MSALGQERTARGQIPTSALPHKAELDRAQRDVPFVPLTSDLRLDAPQQSFASLFDEAGGGDIVS